MSFGNRLIKLSVLLSLFVLLSGFHSLALRDLPPPSVSSVETHPFINTYDQQQVRIRGFWYPLTSEQGILAASPDLKSCCLSSPFQMEQQLIVKGQVASFPSQRVITVEGVFKITPLYNAEGRLIQFYVLEQSKLISSSPFFFLFYLLGGGMTLLVFYWIKRKILLKSIPKNLL